MAGVAEEDQTTTEVLPLRDSHPLPVSRPTGRLAFVLAPPLAVLLGLGAAVAPHATLVATAAVVSVLALVPRVEWAALAVICSAVFGAYLDHLSPWASEWLYAVLLVDLSAIATYPVQGLPPFPAFPHIPGFG